MEEIEQPKIAVIGSGSWGTALVKLLLTNLENVGWWVRREDTKEYVLKHKRNPHYLQYAELLPEKLDISTDLKSVVENYDILVFAIPSAFIDEQISASGITSFEGKTIISAIKGIVPEYNLIIAEYFNQKYKVNFEQIGIIAGPCHAEEVAMQKLSYLTFAFMDQEKAEFIASLFATFYIRTKTSTDINGTEYAAMVKNIFALANGVCIGLGYGDNFQAVLMVNAMREVRRFLKVVFPQYRNIVASEYIGDLLVTAYSKYSRNRMFGTFIGQGYSVKSTMAEMKMVAEGYYAVKCLTEINREHQVEMPITEAVYNILYEGFSPIVEMRMLSEKLS
jgi:glycerol-3-phosphate dehydrogenase (NAD(P)+)